MTNHEEPDRDETERLASADRNNGGTTGRNSDGTFAAGNAGRPRGSRHKTTVAVQGLLEGESEQLTRKAIDLALEGDVTAIRLCLERIAPARKDSPVSFELPEITSADDVAEAAKAVLRAVADAEISPAEGASVMGLIETFRRTIETADIERRIAALEGK